MEKLNLNNILGREEDVLKIKSFLKEYEENKSNLLTKKGIYLYGDPGTGKTTFVTNILKELNYDIIKYDAGDVRNKRRHVFVGRYVHIAKDNRTS